VLSDMDSLILPAVTHWNHPNFHGLFSTSTSSVGVFAEMFAAAFDMKAMLWRTSPASAELEMVTLDWLRQMVGLPGGFEGLIYDTASVSTMQAIAAARERVKLGIREEGMSGRGDMPLLRVYCSEHVHSSIDKSVITLGLGLRSLRKIECDAEFRMMPESLSAAIEEDLAAGTCPYASFRRSERHHPRVSTRLRRLLIFANGTTSGCTSMLLMPDQRRSYPKCVSISPDGIVQTR
jgi:aromatic-L-amino-acid/L-tryptophan decarboxylase